jgi:hypothetical protein
LWFARLPPTAGRGMKPAAGMAASGMSPRAAGG